MKKVKMFEKKEIKEIKSKKIFGYQFLNQKMFNEVAREAGSVIKHNEFQFHYTSLTGKYTIDDEVLYVSIPLVLYNYEQTVSSAHIDFDLKDVEKINEEIQELAQIKAKEVLSKLENLDKYNFEWEIVNFNSMHKHPGGSGQSFSGTDLDTNLKNPGVVYPLANPQGPTPNFAGIMYVETSTGMLKLAHNEVRVAEMINGELYYKLGRTVTDVKGYAEQPTPMEQLFGVKDKIEASYEIKKDGLERPEDIWNVMTIKLTDYVPEIFIDKKLIKEKTYKCETKKYQYGNLFARDKSVKIDPIYEDDIYADDADFDMFETNDDFQYLWDPFSFKGKDRREYIKGLKEEIALNSQGTFKEMYQTVSNLNDIEVVKIAKIQKILIENPIKVKYREQPKK